MRECECVGCRHAARNGMEWNASGSGSEAARCGCGRRGENQIQIADPRSSDAMQCKARARIKPNQTREDES